MDTQSICCVRLGGLFLPQANNSDEWGFSSCCNEKMFIMFYLRCQLVFYIFLDVCEYIVTIWSNSCLAFQTWGNINNLLWVAGIKLLLQCSSYGLIELYLPTRERKLLFTSSVGWRSSSDGPSDVLISSWRCFILTGKTLNVCSPFRLLFCTASKNPLFGLIKRKHYERKKKSDA